MVKRFLLVSNKINVQKRVWRLWILMLGRKGLRMLVQAKVGYTSIMHFLGYTNEYGGYPTVKRSIDVLTL